MEKVKLGECATYINGYAFKPSDWKKEGIPIIRIQNLTGTANNSNYYQGEIDEKYLIQDGDILISWSGSLGIYQWDGGEAYLNQHIFKVKFDKKKIDKKYFIYLVKTKIADMLKNTHGSTMKHITKANFDKIEISLHDEEEQKEIANRLEKIQEIIDFRKKQIQELDELIKSQFVEMFGDPILNPKCFPLKKVEDIVEFQGGSQPDKKFFEYTKTKDNIRLIQIRDYKTNDFITYIPKNLAKRFCDEDDIMIGRYGPPIFQILQGIKGSYNVALMKAIPKKGNKEFVRYFLKQECLLHYLEGLSQRTAGQAGIEMPKLKKYPFPYPPIELQNKFAKFVKKIDKQKFEIQKSLEEIQKLQESLMNKYFGG